ncbi:FH2-domain-containing protein [Trametes elegans]|nr:FH2-domain-containing protein [Trametes elegans]
MSIDPLIVPTVVPGGSLHFATVPADGTVQDVLDTLVANAEVTAEVLGDLGPYGWAVQRIRKEHSGRQWEEDELELLGNGILSPSLSVAPLLNAPSSPTATSHRHFSAFPLTSHLHTPTLRLVSLHPFLSLTFSFLRVPEIHDGFQWKLFLSRSSTVRSAVDAVVEELGLTKVLPIPGGGALEYVLEEVWAAGHSEKATRVPFETVVSEVLENPLTTNPYGSSASRSFRFCVPDEWYRRSKSRSTSSTSTDVSEDTIRRLADLEEGDEEEEEEGEGGTAKQKSMEAQGSPESPRGFMAPVDWRGSISQNRFSSILDSWMRPQSPVAHEEKSTLERKIVSEPKLVEHKMGDSITATSVAEPSAGGIDPAEFEQMLDDLGLKGPKRGAMYCLPPEQKRYLLEQNQVSRASTLSRSSGVKANKPPTTPSTYGPASAAAILPRLVPQLTGDSGIMKRFSISGWSAVSPTPTGPPDSPRSSVDLGSRRRDSMVSIKSPTEKTPEPASIQPQSTGGLWSSWWMSSGGDKANGDKVKEAEKTAGWYAAGIRNGRTTDTKLVKHLISLRVHLSTANLAWVEEFVSAESGMNILSNLLVQLVSKGGKRKKLSEIEDTVLLETIKCLRALLNTEPGFREVLAHPTLITHIAYSLHGSSAKLRTLTSEVLAAICVLSLKEGHKAVLSAMSDYRVEFEEAFRFQELIASMRLPEMTDEEETTSYAGYDNEEEGVWEARTASMALINALTNCPDSLEDRILLREEFSRRGLNEVIVTLRYIKPPESLVTQLDVYTEEKFEDEEDMRERARDVMDHRPSRSESEAVLDDLLRIAKQHEELYPLMLATFKRYGDIFAREMDPQLKADLFAVLDKFVEQAALLDDFDDSWCAFLTRFAESVQHVTGQVVDVRLATDADHSLLQAEIDQLRATVDKLSAERTELRNELDQQVAELNTLKSIPAVPASIGRGAGRGNPESTQNFHGLVQRLVQKEKQVLQLQAELDRFKAQNPAETRENDDRAKRERDRVKWHALNEEIANLKSQTGELEATVSIKEKEIIYLKRALESVYSRFRSREENRESENREAEFDAQAMASRAIDSLTRKDEAIANLQAQIEALKVQLAAKPKFITEKDYKQKVTPPPPPPAKPVRSATAPPPTSGVPNGSSSTPPPPPPPPPPAPRPPPSRSQSVEFVPHEDQVSSPPAPPPPPPPPAPMLPTSAPAAPPPPPPPPPPLASGSGSGLGFPPPPPPPPPPFGGSAGGPPPPLPPPSSWRAGPVKVNRPAKRLKPFFWNKLTAPTLPSTVWGEIPATPDASFDLEDLESTFAIENSPSSSSQLSVSSPTRKQNVTTLLDITPGVFCYLLSVAYVVWSAIMLSRIKIGLSEIRRALLELDDSKLSVDDLRAIGRQLPTSEEVTRLRDFGDLTKLAKADQYFGQIMTIPRVSERLECMLYRRKLELEVEEIRPELNIVHMASRELRSSPKFRRVLQAVLTVGNALNGSTFRGGARGFHLEALLKLRETKTVKASPDCPTLLHYLAKVLLRRDSSLVTFIEDMPHVEAAARVSVPTIMQSVQSLVGGMKQVNEEIQQLRKMQSIPQDRFVIVMQPFALQMSSVVESLKNMSTSLENELRSLLAFYGETPDSPEAPKPEDFFGLILSFSSSLQKAALEVHDSMPKPGPPSPKITVEESASSAGESTIKGTDAQGDTLRPSYSRATARSVGRGDLDQAIRSMRSGKRRERAPPSRPLSKIFVDGARASRIFE